MEDNESRRDVTPDPREDEQSPQNVEEMPVTTDPIKNIMAALGLFSPLPMSAEKSQEEIFEALDAPEHARRIAAVQALGRQCDPLPLAALQKALRHDDEGVRAIAVNILGTLKERAPLELLLESLRDSVWYVRACAAHALGEQIERAPLVPLIEAMHDEDESVRAEAVWALGMLKEYAPEVLLDTLHDPSWLVREAAELIMKERIEQAINNTAPSACEELVELTISGQEGIVLPNKSLLELSGRHLPDTGPLAQHLSVAEDGHVNEQLAEQIQKYQWGRMEEEPDEYGRISLLPVQRKVRERKQSKVKRQQRNYLLEKILAAVLVLGLGVGWYSLDQRFHQSSSASEGNLTCVFHPGSNSGGNVIAWSPDKSNNALFAVAGGDGRVEVYRADSCRHVFEYRQENQSVVLAMKWSVAGLRVAVLTANGHLAVVQENGNTQSNLLLDISAETKVHASQPLVAWSEDGQHLAVNWGDNVVQVWSVSQKKTPLATYTGSYSSISALALSPDGTVLATAAFDAATQNEPIDIWSVTKRTSIVVPSISASARVVAMTWSTDGENLLFYDQSNLVSKWDQLFGTTPLSTPVYAHLQIADAPFLTMARAPDNTRFVISTSSDIQLWSIDNSLLVTIPNTFALVNELGWSMDGKHIAASCVDGTVQLWSVKG